MIKGGFENSSDGFIRSVGKTQEIEKSPIPSWNLVKLGEILDLEYGEGLTSEERKKGDVPVYGANGKIGTHDKPYVEGPGIIVGRKGSIAETEFSEEPFWPIDTTYYISKEETDENLIFVHYLLDNLQLERFNAASAVPGLNRNDAYNLRVILPPLLEQRKIATVLYNVDKAIQKTEEIINQTKRVKKGVMQDFFDEFDAIRKDQNPDNHVYKRLGSLVEFKSGNAFKTKNLSKNGMKVVRISNLNDPEHEYWTYNGDYKESWVVRDGDLLFTWAGLKTSIDVHIYRGEKALLNQHIYNLFPTKEVKKKYLYYYLSYVMPQLYATASGGAKQMHLTKDQIKKVIIPKLPKEKRERIVEVLLTLDKKVRNNKSQKKQLQRLKKGLIQDLLTGKVRTKNKPIKVLEEVKRDG